MESALIRIIQLADGEGEIWRVESGEGDSREILTVTPDKGEALEFARNSAIDRGAKLDVLRKDGSLEWSEDYEWGAHVPEARASFRNAEGFTIRAVSVVENDLHIWYVEGDEPGEILASTADRDQAVAMGRRAAQERHAQLIVHLENGDIEWTEDYAWAEANR